MDTLFQLEKKAARLGDRLFFLQCYRCLAESVRGPKARDYAARMAGLLIRWLEDLVESPPRRPGGTARATSEELADDYLSFCFCFTGNLIEIAEGPADESTDWGPLYAALSRPAQASWERVVGKLFPRLPLAAQLVLSCKFEYIRISKLEADAGRATVDALIPYIESKDLVFDVGGGRRQYLGTAVLVLLTRGEFARDHILRLLTGRFLGGPRNLLVATFNYMCDGLNRATRTFLREGYIARVSARAAAAPLMYHLSFLILVYV
jgi:hypothetical protein